jgi:hypothetical protein
MALSIRLLPEDQILLEHAARLLHVSKSELVRRSVAAYVAKLLPADAVSAEIDALYIGQGGGLRSFDAVASPQQQAILERLREKHGYAD